MRSGVKVKTSQKYKVTLFNDRSMMDTSLSVVNSSAVISNLDSKRLDDSLHVKDDYVVNPMDSDFIYDPEKGDTRL